MATPTSSDRIEEQLDKKISSAVYQLLGAVHDARIREREWGAATHATSLRKIIRAFDTFLTEYKRVSH